MDKFSGSNTVTISEAYQQKEIMESRIQEAIERFYHETGLIVSSLTLTTHEVNDRTMISAIVKAEVKL